MNTRRKESIGEVGAEASARAAKYIWLQIAHARQQRDTADAIIRKFADTLELLADALPEELGNDFRKKLEDVRPDISPELQRVGEVSNNVIELFRRNAGQEWTISEVQNRLSNQGKAAEIKAVYNTMNYLVKTGLLERISRGRYRLREFGFGLDADGLPDDGTTRASEHY